MSARLCHSSSTRPSSAHANDLAAPIRSADRRRPISGAPIARTARDELDPLVVISCVLSAAAGFGARSLWMRRTDEAREAYARGRAHGRRAADREISRADDARKHEVEAAFPRGKETAAADITIEITPFEEVHEGFWSSLRDDRLQEAAPRPGLPVGEASLVIVAQRTKLEREQVKEVLALLHPAMKEAAKALATQGVRALMK